MNHPPQEVIVYRSKFDWAASNFLWEHGVTVLVVVALVVAVTVLALVFYALSQRR